MKTKTTKEITITLNEQEAFVLQNILNSFDWGASGDHYFADLHDHLECLTDQVSLTGPWLERESVLRILSALPK